MLEMGALFTINNAVKIFVVTLLIQAHLILILSRSIYNESAKMEHVQHINCEGGTCSWLPGFSGALSSLYRPCVINSVTIRPLV